MYKPDNDFMEYLTLSQLNENKRGYEDDSDYLDDDTESINEMFRKYTQ